MSDIAKYVPFSLLLGSTPIPFDPNGLEINTENAYQEIEGGGTRSPGLRFSWKKRPFIRFRTTDLAAVASLAFQAYGSGKTITAIKAVYRAMESYGGFGAGYKSYASALGALYPTAIQAGVDAPAAIDFTAVAAFATGSAITVGTDSAAAAAVAKAFAPKQIVIGTSTIVAIRSLSANWQHEVNDDDQYEPAYYYVPRFRFAGQALVKDLAEVTSGRLEDGSSETVSLVFEARVGTNADLTLSLGTCHVQASISGDQATLAFQSVANA